MRVIIVAFALVLGSCLIRLPFLCHGSAKCSILLHVLLQSLFISGLFHQVNEKTCNGVAVWTRYAMWRRSCCVAAVIRLLYCI
jgi:hypothetical protein